MGVCKEHGKSDTDSRRKPSNLEINCPTDGLVTKISIKTDLGKDPGLCISFRSVIARNLL